MIKAIAVLKEHNVLEENIILSNLFCTPIAAKTLVTAFPQVCINMLRKIIAACHYNLIIILGAKRN